MKSTQDKKMTDKQYIEHVLIPVVMAGYASYLYLERETDERHNNLYHHPGPTLAQWTPIVSMQALFLLTATTMIILHMNPGVSNYHPSKMQKIISRVECAEPEVLAAVNTAAVFASRIAFGERAAPIDDAEVKVAIGIEQLVRLAMKHAELHDHKIARSIDIGDGKMTIRYTESLVQHLDEAITYSTEIAAETIYSMMLMGLLSRYFPSLNTDNKLTALAAVYMGADLIEESLMYLVSNTALATEIIIDNKTISSLLKALKIAGNEAIIFEKEDAVIAKIHKAIGEASTRIAQEAAKIQDEAIAAGEAIKAAAKNEAAKILQDANEALALITTETTRLKEAARLEVEELKSVARADAKKILEDTSLVKAKVDEEIGRIETECQKRTEQIEKDTQERMALLEIETKAKLQQLELDAREEAQKLIKEAQQAKAKVEEDIKLLEVSAKEHLQHFEAEVKSEFQRIGSDVKIISKTITNEALDIENSVSGHVVPHDTKSKHYFGESLVNAITGHHHSSTSSAPAAKPAAAEPAAQQPTATNSADSKTSGTKQNFFQREEHSTSQHQSNIWDYFKSQAFQNIDFSFKTLGKIKAKEQDEDKQAREEIQAMENNQLAKVAKSNGTSLVQLPLDGYKASVPFLREINPLDEIHLSGGVHASGLNENIFNYHPEGLQM